MLNYRTHFVFTDTTLKHAPNGVQAEDQMAGHSSPPSPPHACGA